MPCLACESSLVGSITILAMFVCDNVVARVVVTISPACICLKTKMHISFVDMHENPCNTVHLINALYTHILTIDIYVILSTLLMLKIPFHMPKN